jgi:hypothetical protein
MMNFGSEIMNFVSGALMFTTDLKKFYSNKIMVAEETVTILILLLK